MPIISYNESDSLIETFFNNCIIYALFFDKATPSVQPSPLVTSYLHNVLCKLYIIIHSPRYYRIK